MKMLTAAILMITVAASAMAQTGGPSPAIRPDHPIDLKFEDVKWQKIMPDLGNRSPEISILHVDLKNQAHTTADPRAKGLLCASALALR